MFNLLHYLSLSVSLGVLLLCVWVLAEKKTHKEVNFLLYFLIINSIRSVLPIIHNLHWVNCFSAWFWPFLTLYTSFSVNVGYFLYRYFNFMLYPGKKASQSLWHFLPSVLIFLNLWLSYFFKQKIVIQDNFYDTWFSMDLFISVKFMQLVFIGTSLFYLTKIGIDLYQNFSIVKNNFDEIKFLLITIIFLLIFFTGVLAIDVFDKAIFDSGSGNIALKIMLVKPLFILFNFYVFYRNPALLFFGSDNEIKTLGFKYWYLKPRSKNGTMPDEKFHSVEVVKNLILQIESVIKEREVFRNEKYGLRELALEIKMPLGQLRFLFREYCELSFIEYRNYQRVEDFKRCSQQKYDNQNFTIEAIGGKCGFGSMNSLHRSIKKYENCTPSDLWQRTK